MIMQANNTLSSRFEVLRNNALYTIIHADGAAEIANVESSALKMSVKGTFYDYPDDINFLTDRLRPVAVINGVDYPLGVYCITTEVRKHADGTMLTDIEGYSLLYLASRKRIEAPIHIAKGTNYITQIVTLLATCGISVVDAEETAYTFDTDREDWDTGTAVLDIVNQLLAEISYNSAWVSLDGTVKLTKYAQPAAENVRHVYQEGKYSMVESDYSRQTDRFSKSNIFLVTCDNPDKSGPMSAISENNNPESPYSTVNIGRVLHVEQVDNIPSQAALQTYADRLKFQSLQETETVEFITAINPEHETYDTVALSVGEMAGIYQETEWSIDLYPGGEMKHKARRVYNA